MEIFLRYNLSLLFILSITTSLISLSVVITEIWFCSLLIMTSIEFSI